MDINSLINVNFTEFLSQFERVWVWSDCHFRHSNIIRYCNRPFPDSHTMDETLLKNCIDTVNENDLLINVGDFTFGSTEYGNEILSQCKCTNLLIVGNHDYAKRGKIRDLNFDYMSLRETFLYEDQEFILTHIPLHIAKLGTAFNIHGHIHDAHYTENEIVSKYHSCVSVEHTNYTPVLLTDVCEKLLEKNTTFT